MINQECKQEILKLIEERIHINKVFCVSNEVTEGIIKELNYLKHKIRTENL